jgi:hypothetical protein
MRRKRCVARAPENKVSGFFEFENVANTFLTVICLHQKTQRYAVAPTSWTSNENNKSWSLIASARRMGACQTSADQNGKDDDAR